MTDNRERLNEIKWMFGASQGQVFYGTIYESGYVSQRVVDAGEDIKFLLDYIETLENYAMDAERTIELLSVRKEGSS